MFTKEDLEKTVFYLEYENKSDDILKDLKVATSSFCDFVMESIDETTTPKGVAPRNFVEELTVEETEQVWYEDLIGYYELNEGENYYTLSSWGVGGNNYRKGTMYYSTEEAADLALFQSVYDYDFIPDDQRNTMYYESVEEAADALYETLAERLDVSIEVAKHLRRKITILKALKEQRAEEIRQREQNKVEILANAFAQLIEPKEESYRETSKRLSLAMGFKSNRKEFHMAIKIIRNKK